MSEPRHIYSPTNHHQQEIREAKVQHLASDPSGWGDAVPWYSTTIHRIKVMAAGVARIIPFLANSGGPTAIGINRSGSLGSSGDAAAIDHEHATPDIASEAASGWMGTSQVVALNASTTHRQTTGNPHGTQIGDIPNLSSTLSAKADLVGGKIPASQIPGGLDEILEYANRAAFPATGESGNYYLALDTSHLWRWSGSTYIDLTSESGDEYNRGISMDGADPFNSRQSHDGRGGVRTVNGNGPAGLLWYNMVDVRHRNAWNAPSDIWGGELVWGMTGATTRLWFRSRVADGTPGSWIEASTVGHGHATSDVSGLQTALDGKLTRVPTLATNGNANAIVVNGIYGGDNIANAPNSAQGILRVHRWPSDTDILIAQTWKAAGYAGGLEYHRTSDDGGSTWTPWKTNKERDGIGLLRNLFYSSRSGISWFKIATLRVTSQYGSAVFSGIVSTGGGSGGYGDNSSYILTARLKQQNPMGNPVHIVEIDWSQLTGASAYTFGYVVTTDSPYEKVITVYGKREVGYSSTTCAILTREGEVGFFDDVVAETEPPNIVYFQRSVTAPVQKRTYTIGDGSTTVFPLAHYLGTKGVRVTVRKTSAPYNMVECIDELDSSEPTNKVVVGFYGYVPASNEFEVTVMG